MLKYQIRCAPASAASSASSSRRRLSHSSGRVNRIITNTGANKNICASSSIGSDLSSVISNSVFSASSSECSSQRSCSPTPDALFDERGINVRNHKKEKIRDVDIEEHMTVISIEDTSAPIIIRHVNSNIAPHLASATTNSFMKRRASSMSSLSSIGSSKSAESTKALNWVSLPLLIFVEVN